MINLKKRKIKNHFFFKYYILLTIVSIYISLCIAFVFLLQIILNRFSLWWLLLLKSKIIVKVIRKLIKLKIIIITMCIMMLEIRIIEKFFINFLFFFSFFRLYALLLSFNSIKWCKIQYISYCSNCNNRIREQISYL